MPGEQRGGIVPWRMWGDTKTVEMDAATGTTSGSFQVFEQQFARINYARPDTWSFFLSAKVVDQAGNIDGVFVDFDLTIGVGRSSVTIPRFVLLHFDFQNVSMVGRMLWTNTAANRIRALGVPGVPPIPDLVSFTADSHVDTFVAQDIQLKASCLFDPGPDGEDDARVTLEVAAFFSPRTHVRPEWFRGGRYPGSEDQGT